MDEIFATIECLAQVIVKLRSEKAAMAAQIQKLTADLEAEKAKKPSPPGAGI